MNFEGLNDGKSIISFSEYLSLCRMNKEYSKEKKLAFAHPIDAKIISVLESDVVKNAVNKVLDVVVSTQYGLILSSGIPITPTNFPTLYTSLKECCDLLNIQVPYAVISDEVYNGLNAFATGTEEFPFIVVSGMTTKVLNDDELKFIIAHECGHIAMEHITYHTILNSVTSIGQLVPLIGPAVMGTLSLPLSAWSRYSEITSDRAGLLCCGDLRTSQRALIKLLSSFTNISNVDIDDYIDKAMASIENHYVGKFTELMSSHPLIPKRLKALELFNNSKLYYRVSGKQEPEGADLLTDEELNSRTNRLLKVL